MTLISTFIFSPFSQIDAINAMDLMTMRARPNAGDLEEEAFSNLKKEGGHAFVTLRGK